MERRCRRKKKKKRNAAAAAYLLQILVEQENGIVEASAVHTAREQRESAYCVSKVALHSHKIDVRKRTEEQQLVQSRPSRSIENP
jgi:short-subunit dehydrogenase involved in D-alanine esterification of teichoic acids